MTASSKKKSVLERRGVRNRSFAAVQSPFSSPFGFGGRSFLLSGIILEYEQRDQTRSQKEIDLLNLTPQYDCGLRCFGTKKT